LNQFDYMGDMYYAIDRIQVCIQGIASNWFQGLDRQLILMAGFSLELNSYQSLGSISLCLCLS